LRKKAIRKTRTAKKPARAARTRKSVRRKAPAAVPASAAVPAPAAGPTPIRSRSVLIAIVALSGAVIVAAMGRSRGPEPAATDVSLAADIPTDVPSSALEIEAAPPAAKAPPPPESRTTTAAAAIPTPALAEPVTPDPKPEPGEASAPLIVAPAATIDTPTSTIVGCLAFADGAFRLKDASGADAPKSRSWKSGFLRKRSATIDVVDPSQSLALEAHVGQRVEVAGTLLEREIQARSLQRLAESCKK
jgi:hypothetical protein